MSTKKYTKALFIFRRDLRLFDNTALYQALTNAKAVIPLFIFDPVQVGKKNKYRSMNALQFMVESLKELEQELQKKKGRLYLLYGKTTTIVERLLEQEAIDALFINYDYTPFARKRDAALEQLCKKSNCNFHGFHDELLIGDPASVLTGKNTPYSVYTAFYKKAVKKKVASPQKKLPSAWYAAPIKGTSASTIYKKIVPKNNPQLKVNGGRRNALTILRSLKKYKNYNKERNFPALDATTHLSAAHKFGTISIRESYHAIKKTLGNTTQLLRELYWRDFFTYIAFHNPHVFGAPYHKKYAALAWSVNKKHFLAWCKGSTGFPIVDAGMRQLNTTGWMHNRTRMIVASFLVKDLHINWLWGEQYFAQQLVDYDSAVNNGNWQWAASTGCDAQPYFRIFNPWTQQKKFDAQAAYIYQWIPELKNIPAKQIHTWYKEKNSTIKDYPRPIVDHAKQRTVTLKLYKSVKK